MLGTRLYIIIEPDTPTSRGRWWALLISLNQDPYQGGHGEKDFFSLLLLISHAFRVVETAVSMKVKGGTGVVCQLKAVFGFLSCV